MRPELHSVALTVDLVPIDRDQFRNVLASFASGVAIVSSSDDRGICGATTTALCSVSDTPPSLLVCMARTSRTLEGINASGGFVVNILSAGREALVERFARSGGTKFANVNWQPSPSFGAPVLVDDIVAHAECAVLRVLEYADHVVVVGLILDSSIGVGSPLLYYRRAFGRWHGLTD
jgi:flavin reductase (DIM6/NTAB) family NADH-FMN oxidoreductase RutF